MTVFPAVIAVVFELPRSTCFRQFVYRSLGQRRPSSLELSAVSRFVFMSAEVTFLLIHNAIHSLRGVPNSCYVITYRLNDVVEIQCLVNIHT